MIFADKFEAASNLINACVFLGASLTVNGIDQGEILEAPAASLSPVYNLEINGYFWAEVLAWECGESSDGHFVRLAASVDYFTTAPRRGFFSIVASDPKDVCGNPLGQGKGVFCP